MQRQSKQRTRSRARALRGKRAVSEVLGTILILALTVTLFSSIFFFVSTFPKPATQPASQFQGELYYSTVIKGTHTWVNVSSVTITHLGGPAIYNFNTLIYVVSQAHPQNTTTVYTLTSGGLGSGPSVSWGTGQVWNLSLAGDHLTTPDNITVTVVSANLVVYRQTLPGTNPTIPPIYEQEGTEAASPVVNTPFSIFVQINDPFLRSTSNKVLLNITTPGLSCPNPLSADSSNTTTLLRMTYNGTNGLWFITGCTTAVAGTYYVTVWTTDTNPIQVQQNSIIFPISVSSTSGSGGGSAVQVSIITNTSAPVISQILNVTVVVTNNGAASGTATVGFGATPSGGTFTRVIATGTVPAGGSVGFQTTYTPATKGSLLLNASASIPGIGSGTDTLALTVFPHIILISMNQPGGIAQSKSNESANLASELTAAGFPFKTFVNSCTNTSFPTSLVSQFTSGTVVVIDFGSNSSNNAACPNGPTANSTASGNGHSVAYNIENSFSTGTSWWVVGARAFSTWSPCGTASGNPATYQAYLQVFGIATSATCTTAQTLAAVPADYASVTYTAASSLLGQGISSPINLNGNVSTAATFLGYRTLTPGGAHAGTAFMTIGATDLGVFYGGSGATGKGVAIGASPVQFGDAPAGPSWNAIGAEVAYNVMNYLCGLATTTAPTRAGTDFGIAGAYLTGTSHATPSTFLVNLRDNDAVSGIATVTLLVNGVPALYQGTFVEGTAVPASNGGVSWVSLTWQAPSAGTYVFSFVLSTQPTDGFLLNNQYNYFLIPGLGITFT